MAKHGTRYVRPLERGTYKQGRTDQGVDFVAKNGAKIRAMGDAVVVFVGPYQGFGPSYVAYKLTSGRHKGEVIYIGHSRSVVKVGQRLTAGQTVARAAGFDTSTYGKPQVDVEIGFAQRSGTYLPLAQVRGGYHEGQVTSEGQRFLSFLAETQGGPPMTPDATTASAPASTPTDTMPADVAATVPVVPDQGQPTGGPPPPETATPSISAPGSLGVGGYTPQRVAETWQLLASQPLPSPETQSYAERARLASSGTG